ncbi:hypothetical protein [Dyella lutea]|uniref:Uncharacterized protein n=1 Tax=Dyella lutea TaxID=2950441 RepID=A0ABT1FDB3_9GAMM|nr:hypothetical protein [Dyella lutea]MCP1375367.1 hypothetical protein [Dyella lutea]
MFKALFFIECAPAGAKASIDLAHEMTCSGRLPFVPHPGMQLSVSHDGDYFTVETVFWKVDVPDVLEVFFREDMHHDEEYFARQGWEAVR